MNLGGFFVMYMGNLDFWQEIESLTKATLVTLFTFENQ